jgi:hypothetical protein
MPSGALATANCGVTDRRRRRRHNIGACRKQAQPSACHGTQPASRVLQSGAFGVAFGVWLVAAATWLETRRWPEDATDAEPKMKGPAGLRARWRGLLAAVKLGGNLIATDERLSRFDNATRRTMHHGPPSPASAGFFLSSSAGHPRADPF